MDNFCGSEFWNQSMTWDVHSRPDFTPCFENTVLVWIPCLFLWGWAPVEAYFLVKSRNRNIPISFLNVAKVVCTSVLMCVQLLVLVYTLTFRSRANVFEADYVAPSILFLSFFLQIVVVFAEKRLGVQSSAYLFIFWLLMVACRMFSFRSHFLGIINGTESPESVSFITDVIQYLLIVIMFALNFFSDKRPQKLFHPRGENSWPEEDASFPSKLTFSWFSALVWRGYREPLTCEMLWNIPYVVSSRKITEDFDQQWLKNSERRNRFTRDGYEPLRVTTDSDLDRRRPVISIVPVLVRTFGRHYIFASLVQLVSDLLKFAFPLLTSILISFTKDLSQPAWRGYYYAFLFFFVTQVNTLFRGVYFDVLFDIGVKVRTAVISAVYRKALKISNSAKKESTVGEIVNLMAIDAQQFLYVTPYINMIWSSPLQIILSLYYLWHVLGTLRVIHTHHHTHRGLLRGLEEQQYF